MASNWSKSVGALTAVSALVAWAFWSTGAAASTPVGRSSAGHHAAACPEPGGSSAPAAPAPEDGLQQSITVVVPAVALIEDAGKVLNVRSNTGRPPTVDDMIYVRVRGGYELAGAELLARIEAAEWRAVGSPGECAHWLGSAA